MDIQRATTKKPIWKRYWWLIPAVALLMAVYLLKNTLGDASVVVTRNDVIIAKVQQGNFRVTVRSTGVLKPLDIRWVSSQVAGKIEQVLVKPGSNVKAGDTLMLLSNPELHRELEKMRWEVKARKAESYAAYVTLESQLVDLENSVLAANFSYQAAKLKLDAETILINQNNGTVSALDYQKSQLSVKQQAQYWQAQQQKTEKMKANMTATKTAQLARIGLVENNYERVKEQVAALSVKASTDGVIQQVSFELGERVQIGDSIALIADQSSLFAELQVQEVRAREIAIGQTVWVDTRTSKIEGRVNRIDPAVNAGMVLVDVTLTKALPTEARPELTVDGIIEISSIDNALYVKRPVFAPKNGQIGLYKLSENKQFASKTEVKLGQSSVNNIQIISGLAVGDEVIISDSSNWQEHQNIMIN